MNKQFYGVNAAVAMTIIYDALNYYTPLNSTNLPFYYMYSFIPD